MNILWIRLKTVVLYEAKQTDDVLGYEKTDHHSIGISIHGITVVFVIKNFDLKIEDFSVVLSWVQSSVCRICFIDI